MFALKKIRFTNSRFSSIIIIYEIVNNYWVEVGGVEGSYFSCYRQYAIVLTYRSDRCQTNQWQPIVLHLVRIKVVSKLRITIPKTYRGICGMLCNAQRTHIEIVRAACYMKRAKHDRWYGDTLRTIDWREAREGRVCQRECINVQYILHRNVESLIGT